MEKKMTENKVKEAILTVTASARDQVAKYFEDKELSAIRIVVARGG
jgi:Fe-S cluster assembly iron-binding protein IscA